MTRQPSQRNSLLLVSGSSPDLILKFHDAFQTLVQPQTGELFPPSYLFKALCKLSKLLVQSGAAIVVPLLDQDFTLIGKTQHGGAGTSLLERDTEREARPPRL